MTDLTPEPETPIESPLPQVEEQGAVLPVEIVILCLTCQAQLVFTPAGWGHPTPPETVHNPIPVKAI